MELTKEQLDFLNKCEAEFHNRYTDADEDFLKVKLSTLTDPPILDPWSHETNGTTRGRQRYYNKHLQRRSENSGGYSRYNDRERHNDSRGTKRKKWHHRDNRERNDKKSADRREKNDGTRSRDKKWYRKKSRWDRDNSYRDEDRDGRYKKDNNNRDKRRYGDYYTGRSEDRQKCRVGEKKEQEPKRKVHENNNPILYIWNTYGSKHDLYENYRPYF